MYTSHPPGVKTAFKAGNRYRVQTTFPDGTEMLEEYDAMTQHLECRRWRSTRPFRGVTEWDYEIGDPPSTHQQDASGAGIAGAIRPSSLNPTFHPRDTRQAWEWHIRNLPYPEETYSLGVDNEKQTLILRTTNKKYFKVFQVPALLRAGIALQRSRARMSHNGGSTLVISYEKPDPVVDQEREARTSAARDGGDGGFATAMAKKGMMRVGRDGTRSPAPVAGVAGS
ncbi:unnamed protein product [Pylaiella littoralis]